MALLAGAMTAGARTLIVYYSYTNNVERIVSELSKQIEADVIEIEPAEKGLTMLPMVMQSEVRRSLPYAIILTMRPRILRQIPSRSISRSMTVSS